MSTVASSTWYPTIEDREQFDRDFIVWGECHGRWHGARPLVMTYEKLASLWAFHSEHSALFNDDILPTFERFAQYMMTCVKLPFEIVSLPDKRHVGYLYITNPVMSETEKLVVEAAGHFSFWDGDFSHRRDILRELIDVGMKSYKIHRLVAMIPVYARGALRAANKLGFGGDFETKIDGRVYSVEGIMRKAIRYKGEWRDVATMSLVGG